MKRSETDVLYDANGEAGSFLTQHPLLCLTDTIFEETEAGLEHHRPQGNCCPPQNGEYYRMRSLRHHGCP